MDCLVSQDLVKETHYVFVQLAQIVCDVSEHSGMSN